MKNWVEGNLQSILGQSACQTDNHCLSLYLLLSAQFGGAPLSKKERKEIGKFEDRYVGHMVSVSDATSEFIWVNCTSNQIWFKLFSLNINV